MDIEKLTKAYDVVREKGIKSRLTTPEQVFSLCQTFGAQTTVLGTSVLGRPICSVKFGRGARRILLWTQMHGNEPTATGAVFDVLNFFRAAPGGFERFVREVQDGCSLTVVPMLNPDGAALYRRTNALDIDLNRDALALSAPESRILRGVFAGFQPHYCFNLHDQRNIYNVSGTGKTATISFLAPSEDALRSVTPGRKAAMAVIHAMDRCVQQIVPGHVGRYSDEFYPTAVGDNSQKAGHVTMLIESGAYPGDPERRTARFCNFAAILSALEFLCGTDDPSRGWEKYDDIPANDTRMLDVIVRGVRVSLGGCSETVDIGVLLSEKPVENRSGMRCRAFIESIGDLRYSYGIREVDASGKHLAGFVKRCPQVGDEVELPVRLE